jgi:hypothetical protein
MIPRLLPGLYPSILLILCLFISCHFVFKLVSLVPRVGLSIDSTVHSRYTTIQSAEIRGHDAPEPHGTCHRLPCAELAASFRNIDAYANSAGNEG